MKRSRILRSGLKLKFEGGGKRYLWDDLEEIVNFILEDSNKRDLARNQKDKIVGRKKGLETLSVSWYKTKTVLGREE
jgi:hypothetical protein